MTSSAQVVELFGRQSFDFDDLQNSATESDVIARDVCVEGYGQAVLLLRVHANALNAVHTAKLRVVGEAPTCEDPDQDFLFDLDAAALQVDSSTAVGTLLTADLMPDFGYALRVIMDRSTTDPGPLSGSVDLSAEIVLRPGASRRKLHEEAFAYTTSSTSKLYVPFRTFTAATSIDLRRRMIAPVAGRVELVWLYSDGSPVSATVGFHKNGNTTATESVTANWSGAPATAFRFSPDARFDAGDLLSISVQPSASPGGVSGLLVLSFDSDFGPNT